MPRYGPHQPLSCARALYIGRAAPQACHDGLDSCQKPLAELYNKTDKKCIVEDYESSLYVFTSGLLMKPVNPLDKEIWLRIQDLESCAAVKAYDDPAYGGQLMFVPVDSPAARATRHPPIFSVIMKRTAGGIKISDCHAFLCNSSQSAMTLVQACEQAFADRRGWSSERPSLIELGLEQPEVRIDNERYVDDEREDCGPEFYEKPSLSGFFYAPRSDLIEKFNIRGEDDYGRPLGQTQMIEHFTEPEPPRLPACQPPPGCMSVAQFLAIPEPDMVCAQPVMPVGQQMMVGHQQYIVPQQAQMLRSANPHEPVYMTSLPHEDLIIAENKRRGIDKILPVKMAKSNRGDYRMHAMQSGMGDYGPPDMDPYSRHLPVTQIREEVVYGGRNFDGNFILKQAY